MNMKTTPVSGEPTDEREALPAITDEDRQFICYNPNTNDLVEWAQNYALLCIQPWREALATQCGKTLVALSHSDAGEPAQPPAEPEYVTLGIGDEEIDLIAADGMRNAAGGIYATSVYEFARAVEAAVLARWHAHGEPPVQQKGEGLAFDQWWFSNGNATTEDVEALCARCWDAALASPSPSAPEGA